MELARESTPCTSLVERAQLVTELTNPPIDAFATPWGGIPRLTRVPALAVAHGLRPRSNFVNRLKRQMEVAVPLSETPEQHTIAAPDSRRHGGEAHARQSNTMLESGNGSGEDMSVLHSQLSV